MHHFEYKGQKLHAEGVALDKIATKTGTPVFVYSLKTLRRHINAFSEAFSSAPHIICYSVKANSNIAILKTFAREGSGFDIVSAGELYRVVKAGGDSKKVVFSGVGKKVDEIEFAIKKNILMFNAESPEELAAINAVAKRLKKKVAVAIRINPDVNPKTHPYISTGLKKNKFGIETEEAIKQYAYAKSNYKNLDMAGVDCHIGSQITELTPFGDALEKVKDVINRLRKTGTNIRYLDMGGGLGITYKDEAAPHPSNYGTEILKRTAGLGVTLIFEPGRNIVGNAGVLVTRVVYTKQGSLKKFVISDAAMNDLPRPSLYGSYHAIKPVDLRKSAPDEVVDVVGPICESGDFFAHDREISKVTSGELLALMSAGAYCFSMSSNYNSRPRAAEVIVDGKDFHVIRKRETLEDIVRNEVIPAKLFKGAKARKGK
ncbi:MAG: diaminopimelate decarboxylase [Deltaproteobacteria bacterium]|nr:diaminopimelate decarboxylase [Deltaproteobacteria bacterium]